MSTALTSDRGSSLRLLSPADLRTALIDGWHKREVLWTFVVRDLRSRHLGSYLGFVWTFVQPLITLLVLWFVFEVGFKARPTGRAAFIVWLACGLIPWQFFNEALSSASASVVENGFVIKKVLFRSSILPVVKVLSALVIHGFFVLFLVALAWGKGSTPSWYALQILYYAAAAAVLALGIAWSTAAVTPFVPDVGQVVLVVLQFGFWLTPIFWSTSMLPEHLVWWFKLNPLYYIVEGYRGALIDHVGFWERPMLTLYFWILCLVVWIAGALVFRRLRPHFADVL